MNRSSISIVLVEPLYAGNIGSVARAMGNMGLKNLILVRPRCDPKSLEAIKMAVGARDLLLRAKVVSTLEEAMTRAHVVVGTTRREGRHRRAMMDARQLADWIASLNGGKKVAILFGREDRGLTNPELARCQYRIRIPSHASHPSLNVAQAVMVVAYELFIAKVRGNDSLLPPDNPLARTESIRCALASAGNRQIAIRKRSSLQKRRMPKAAPAGLTEAMYRHFEETLLAIGFLDPVNPLRGMRIVRGILGRAELTAGEVAFVRGICRQILWSAQSKEER